MTRVSAMLVMMLLLAGCRSAPEVHAPAQSRLLSESMQPIAPEATSILLDQAERYLQHLQREVPSFLRARSTRVTPRLLVVEVDLLAVQRFTSPLMHAVVGGFPVRAELTVIETPGPCAHWRIYYVGTQELSEDFTPFPEAFFETFTQVILSEERW